MIELMLAMEHTVRCCHCLATTRPRDYPDSCCHCLAITHLHRGPSNAACVWPVLIMSPLLFLHQNAATAWHSPPPPFWGVALEMLPLLGNLVLAVAIGMLPLLGNFILAVAIGDSHFTLGYIAVSSLAANAWQVPTHASMRWSTLLSLQTGCMHCRS